VGVVTGQQLDSGTLVVVVVVVVVARLGRREGSGAPHATLQRDQGWGDSPLGLDGAPSCWHGAARG